MAFPRTKVKAPHHRGSHQRRAKAITDAGYADPNATCWRCGQTLANCKPHKNGKPAIWTAGHLVAGQEGGPYALECSPCNTRAGAELGAQRSNAVQRPRRTDLTW